jgi:predicted acyltransferase
MILVNHAPPRDDMYAPFRHAEWTGWTFADTIFPAFLFIMGISIVLSSAKRSVSHSGMPISRTLRRTALLILLSIALTNFPYYELAKFQLYGTLFRIAVCYFIVALIYFNFNWTIQVGLVICLLLSQSAILLLVNASNAPGVTFVPGDNASHYLDLVVFGDFSRALIAGPAIQGIVPTIGAVASTLIGVLIGTWLKGTSLTTERVSGLMTLGFVFLFVGTVIDAVIPISKPIWTPSYVIFMTGLSMQILGVCYWVTEILDCRRCVYLFEVAGVNALFFYVFAQSVQRILVYGHIYTDDGSAIRLRYLIYDNWFAPWISGQSGAMLYSLCFLLLCYLAVYSLYRHRIFIKL